MGLISDSRMPGMRRKLIEVALPLDTVNAAVAREKSIRPRASVDAAPVVGELATARAVLFAQMVGGARNGVPVRNRLTGVYVYVSIEAVCGLETSSGFWAASFLADGF